MAGEDVRAAMRGALGLFAAAGREVVVERLFTATGRADARRLVMRGPDGSVFPNEITFAELDPPSRLVLEPAHQSGSATR